MHITPWRIGLSGVGLCMWSLGGTVKAAEPMDKSGHTLLNPTPSEQMREMATDRPDITESPFTVDAGHLQIETGLASWTYDRRNADSVRRTELAYGDETNLRLGLLNNVELGFVFTPYSRERRVDPAAGQVSYADGFSDVQLRGKINFFGNDEGRFALGLMPVLQFPTGSDDLSSDHVQGGILLPLAMRLTESLGLCTMLEVDFLYDKADRGYDTQLLHSIVLDGELCRRVGGYVEYTSIWSGDADTQYQGILGTGLLFDVGENWVVDVGVNVGLTRAADDLNVFCGLSWRY